MTREERLAALQALFKGLEAPLVYVDGDLHAQTERWGVKVAESVPSKLVQELCLCVDGCEYHAIKSHDGVPCCMVLRSEQGYNHFLTAHRTRVRAGEWVKAEIAKLEQPAPAKPASALPYKVLLNSMDARMGYDEQEKHHYLFVTTDGNDSRMLFHDIGWELTESTGAVLRIVDMDSLYMLFNTKTKADSEAREIEAKVVEWTKKRIAEIEQPPFDPKEAIEAAAADQQGMDAAESLLDREQMRFEMGRKVHDFQSAVHHLYKALDAGYAKDDEIAALKKENKDLREKNIGWEQRYMELLAGANEEIQRLNELLDERKEDIRTLNGVISAQVQDFSQMEASRDEYKKLYQEALAAAEAQRISLEAKLSAAEHPWVQPAPVRLPVAGDTVEARFSPDHEWEKVEVYNSEWRTPRFIIGKLTVKACQETYDKGNWRWPEPRTRTAADAKIGDRVFFWYDESIRTHGSIIGLGDSSAFAQANDNTIHRLPHCEFGPTGWRFTMEETK